MICPVCKHDAPYTQVQWDRRKRELERHPGIEIYPCPECGGTDWMLATVNISQPPPPYDGMLAPRSPPTGSAEAVVAALKRRPQPQPSRIRMYYEKELRPPRSLWAWLLDWWSFRK